MRHAPLIVALVTFAAACGSGDSLCLPNCEGTRDYDAQSYALHARYDWAAARLVASEDITLAGVHGTVVSLDAAMQIDRVHAGDVDLAWTQDPGGLRVDVGPIADATGSASFTVDYQATPSDSLLPTFPRDDDPVRTRVVFTDSEPDRGLTWMVAKQDPSDRARWSVELTVAADEDVIANGERVRDERTSDGRRIVGYALAQPIPAYLMAFAAGQLDHTDRTTGRVPIAVWYRRGFLIDPQETLDIVSDAMATYENLAGPYPWPRYSVVYVPQYGGGMENATITFNGEHFGQGNVNLAVNVHELAHHWFGDWVTVRTFDDIWFKEGMATLLESEAQRSLRDAEGRARGFGLDFAFSPSASIRDTSLTGLSRYNSGPYQRSAWLLTQIRRHVGEAAFWASLRKMLADHALGSVSSEELVRSFAPALDEPTIQAILLMLDRKQPPAIGITTAASGPDTRVTLTFNDSGVVLDPLHVTVVDASGVATTSNLVANGTLAVTVPAGGYLAPDEDDGNPRWTTSFNVDTNAYYAQLVPLFTPTAAPALAAFETRSAAVQERALGDSINLPVPPAGFAAFYAALDSVTAQRLAAMDGCSLARGLADPTPWYTALTPALSSPATTNYNTRFGACGNTLPPQLFGAEIAALAPSVTAVTAPRLEYLMSFDYGAATSLQVIGAVVTTAPSLRLREIALARLASQATPSGGYSAIPGGEVPTWKAFFRGSLITAASSTRFQLAWRGVKGLVDDGALVTAAQKLHTVPMSAGLQAQTVCDAYSIAFESRPQAWTDFQNAAQPWMTLSVDAQALLAEPGSCP